MEERESTAAGGDAARPSPPAVPYELAEPKPAAREAAAGAGGEAGASPPAEPSAAAGAAEGRRHVEAGAAAGQRRGLVGRLMDGPVSATKQVFSEFLADDAFTLAAALAYYTALSFAPLIILLLALASFLGPGARSQLQTRLSEMLDPRAAEVMLTIIESGQQPNVRTTAGLVSLAALLFSASGVFAQLQGALNRIWNVKAKPGGGVKAWVRKRLLSFGMVLALAFVLVVSVAATAVIAGAFGKEGDGSTLLGKVLQAANTAATIGVFTLLFGLIFKYLPDVRIAWRDVWFGALVTALLFAAGKWLIGLYLGRGAVGSSYGAAGSLIALLVWVYYSGLILFLGAEVTEVMAERRGSSIEPDEYAVRVTDAEARSA